jgi:hypothetical protein
MEQNTMEQLMEFMETQIGSLERKMDSNQDKMEAERKADKAEMMARMEAKMDSNQEKTGTAINSLRSALEGAIKTRVEVKACREATHASFLLDRLSFLPLIRLGWSPSCVRENQSEFS